MHDLRTAIKVFRTIALSHIAAQQQ